MITLFNLPSLKSSLARVADFCRDNADEEIEIIVPDKLSLYMEKFIFEALNIECSFNIRVNTFNRFAKRAITIPKEKQITKIGSIILINKILNENIQNLKVLKSKAYSFSYAEEIFATISQLKASKITYEDMNKFSCDNIELQDKILDLALVFEEYEKGKAGLLDASDVFLMSTLYISNGLKCKKIVFVGFDDFTAIEYSIIERLAIEADLYICNYYGQTGNRHIYNNEVYSQLKNLAIINELGFKVENFSRNETGLNNFLETNLFSLTNETYTLDDDRIQIFSGKNLSSELEFVARDIRYRVLKGENYFKFGVAIYGLDGIKSKIKEIFSKYEINYYLDCEFNLSSSILYKFLITIFKYNLENYSLTHLIDLINSPFLLIEQTKKEAIIDKLLTIRYNDILLDKIDFGEELSETISILKEYLDLLIIDKNDNIINIAQMFIHTCEVLNVDKILMELSNTCVRLQDRVLLLKSKDLILNILDEILKFYPVADIHTIYDIILHIGSVSKINNIPLTLDAVKIVDANNSMEVFDNLYLVNCTSENAPNLKYDCGIILDSEIDRLNFNHKLAPTIAHINRLSKLRLYNTALLFNDRLSITYSGMCSELVKEINKRIIFNTPVKMPLHENSMAKHQSLSKWDYIETVCNDKSFDEETNEYVKKKNIFNLSKENIEFTKKIDKISASQLENYFKCPFYYFVNNLLKIRPRLDNEIKSVDVGNILHELLFIYYKREKNILDLYEFCRDEIFRFLDRDDRLKLNINSPIITNLIDEAVRVINGVNYIDSKSEFLPNKNYLEYSFTTDKVIDNIDFVGKVDRVDFSEAFMRIVDYKTGSVDASLKDLYYGNKLQLFLYANAMNHILDREIVGGFYLPLHNDYRDITDNPYSMIGYYRSDENVVHALDKTLSSDGKSDIVNLRLTKSGSAYRSSDKVMSADELSRVLKYASDVSSKAVSEIRSGYIEPTPSEVSKPCNYCPYAHVCRRSSNNIKTRSVCKVSLDSMRGEE